MDYKKPQSTLVQGGAGIYPLTTADQVILADGSRLEKDGKIIADSTADSAKLGGQLPAYYAKASDVSGKADKSSLDGLRKSIFINENSTVISSMGLPNKPTSESNVLYTVPADGLFYLYADRGSVGGYTLFVTIIKPNGDVLTVLNFPAYDPYAVICTFIPLSSGMKIKLSTDNSAETWTIRKQQFIY